MYREENRTKSHRITVSLNDIKFNKWSELINKENITSQKKLENYIDTELNKIGENN
jgi:hypothetical protein